MTPQIVRDWVIRFNAEGPDGLVDRKAPGQKRLLDDRHRAALAAMIESGPTPWLHGVVRWRIVDLCRWLWEAFQLGMSPQTLSRELRAIGYRRLSAPPWNHAQVDGAIEALKKAWPALPASDFSDPIRAVCVTACGQGRGQDGDPCALAP